MKKRRNAKESITIATTSQSFGEPIAESSPVWAWVKLPKQIQFGIVTSGYAWMHDEMPASSSGGNKWQRTHQ